MKIIEHAGRKYALRQILIVTPPYVEHLIGVDEETEISFGKIPFILSITKIEDTSSYKEILAKVNK